MKAYIRSTVSISPQNTFDGSEFLDGPIEYYSNRLTCIEPDYKDIIDPKLIRRMSRVIKMGVASGLACLNQGNISVPDAIITGTAYGCLADTGVFLTNMIEQDEEPLSPTAFVHSTHNTIGAQIALLIKCHQYNSTFVNGGASFENALLDGLMLMADGSVGNVLVGGVDEITNYSHSILSRFGLYKNGEVSNLEIFHNSGKGTINGEGATFFLLTDNFSPADLASLDAVETFYKPGSISETEQYIASFLERQPIKTDDIDVVIFGDNGDVKNDSIYRHLRQSIFSNNDYVNYKHLCGDYPTSTAFATWIGANILKNNNIPPGLSSTKNTNKKINKVLIYNHYQNTHHSLILLSAC